MNEEIEEVQSMYTRLTAELILSGVNPLLMSGVLCASGIQLYKSNLEKEEFRKMMKIIHQEAIKPL